MSAPPDRCEWCDEHRAELHLTGERGSLLSHRPASFCRECVGLALISAAVGRRDVQAGDPLGVTVELLAPPGLDIETATNPK